MSTLHFIHTSDETVCDLGPSTDVSDPESICGHGFNIHTEWLDEPEADDSEPYDGFVVTADNFAEIMADIQGGRL